MSKEKKSKLDRYAEVLLQMDGEKKTLAEMQAWLKDEGITVAPNTISRFLESARQSRLQDKLLAQIASGSRQCQEVEKRFGKNPAPELGTLVKLHQVLVMQLSTMGNADPEFLKLADQLLRTVLEAQSGKTKAAQKERELKLAEDKFQIEFCERMLDEATRVAAEKIATSGLSQADKIAAMRKAAFADVAALEASGELNIPK